jgi:hypothetical protein
MTIDLSQRKLLLPLIISLLLHLVGLKALEFLPKDFLSSKKAPQKSQDKPIQIRSITRKELKKYRTVGVKNGEKTFSLPVKDGAAGKNQQNTRAALPPKVIKVRSTKKKKGRSKKESKKNISLNSLQVKPGTSAKVLNTKMKRLEEDKSKSNKLEITTNNPVIYNRTKEVQTDVLKQLATSSDNAQVLRKTGFNMQLEPPEGISEDELNSMEKIFYSFKKRTFRAYVGSFLKTYKQTLLEHPAVKESLKNELHRLAARVVFDSEGNIMRIKILRSSNNDDIHDMFEETLKEIYKLPNPPKDLLQKNGEFTIYYQLKIN